MDRVDRAIRSKNMAAVKSKNTQPELAVRRVAHRLGYRFRLHRTDLPGKPDIVFPRLRLAVFVHGCFWHQHPNCTKSVLPTSNSAFWSAKLTRNVARDKQNTEHLNKLGWATTTIWECETKNQERLFRKMERCLSAFSLKTRR